MPTSAAMMRYVHSEKGKETLRRYWQSERGKVARNRYRSSDKGKETTYRYYLKRLESGYWHKNKGIYNRRVRITLDIPIYVERDENDTFHSWSPLFKGLHTEGYCTTNAVANAKMAAEAYIKSLIKHGDPIPTKPQNESCILYG